MMLPGLMTPSSPSFVAGIRTFTGGPDPLAMGPEDHYFRFAPDGENYMDAPVGSSQLQITFLKNGLETVIQLSENLIFLSNGSISPNQDQMIFAINSEWLFNRYSTMFHRAVNFFPHAWHLKSRISSCIPCLPYLNNA
jgi:hypothetical protein